MDLESVLGAKRGSENGPMGSKMAKMSGREDFFGHPIRGHFSDEILKPSEADRP